MDVGAAAAMVAGRLRWAAEMDLAGLMAEWRGGPSGGAASARARAAEEVGPSEGWLEDALPAKPFSSDSLSTVRQRGPESERPCQIFYAGLGGLSRGGAPLMVERLGSADLAGVSLVLGLALARCTIVDLLYTIFANILDTYLLKVSFISEATMRPHPIGKPGGA
jgi:hypothetical protein